MPQWTLTAFWNSPWTKSDIILAWSAGVTVCAQTGIAAVATNATNKRKSRPCTLMISSRSKNRPCSSE